MEPYRSLEWSPLQSVDVSILERSFWAVVDAAESFEIQRIIFEAIANQCKVAYYRIGSKQTLKLRLGNISIIFAHIACLDYLDGLIVAALTILQWRSAIIFSMLLLVRIFKIKIATRPVPATYY